MSKTLEEVEAESHTALTSELADSRTFLNAVVELVGKSALSLRKEDLTQQNSATRVAVLLGIRLINDSRGVSLLARIGYGMQAAALASSIYEIAYTLAYIGADNALADQWFDHDKVLSTPFGDILKVTKGGLTKLGIPEQKAFDEYQIYSQLCMAKHGNPLLQRQHGLKVTNETVSPQTGPDTSDASIRLCRFALEMSGSSILIALQSFISNHAPEQARPNLQSYHQLLQQECLRLRQSAIKRWGSEDPNPGKWRTK